MSNDDFTAADLPGPTLAFSSIAEARRALNVWLPIDTAPKDGQQILVFHPRIKIVCVTSWQSGKWQDLEYGGIDRGPTHWQPLPEPPPV